MVTDPVGSSNLLEFGNDLMVEVGRSDSLSRISWARVTRNAIFWYTFTWFFYNAEFNVNQLALMQAPLDISGVLRDDSEDVTVPSSSSSSSSGESDPPSKKKKKHEKKKVTPSSVVFFQFASLLHSRS